MHRKSKVTLYESDLLCCVSSTHHFLFWFWFWSFFWLLIASDTCLPDIYITFFLQYSTFLILDTTIRIIWAKMTLDNSMSSIAFLCFIKVCEFLLSICVIGDESQAGSDLTIWWLLEPWFTGSINPPTTTTSYSALIKHQKLKFRLKTYHSETKITFYLNQFLSSVNSCNLPRPFFNYYQFLTRLYFWVQHWGPLQILFTRRWELRLAFSSFFYGSPEQWLFLLFKNFPPFFTFFLFLLLVYFFWWLPLAVAFLGQLQPAERLWRLSEANQMSPGPHQRDGPKICTHISLSLL